MRSQLWFYGANAIALALIAGVLAGAALPKLRMRVFSRDYLSGLLFVAVGVGALWFGQRLNLGTPVRMGPGFVPKLLALCLCGLGGLVAVKALVAGGAPPERGYLRPITLITVAIIAFAMLLETFGLVPATIAAVVIAAAGGFDSKWVQTGISLVILLAIVVGVFKYALGLPMDVFKLPR